MLTWAELGARSLAGQFPTTAPGEVAAAVGQLGPIQSQTARSVFIGLAARVPGATREAISAAYESFAIVRGSSLRGTVHTSTAAQHPWLEVVTRIGQRALWARMLRLAEKSLEDVWAGIEEFAWDAWRTPDELAGHLRAWLATNDPRGAPRLRSDQGRYFAFGHAGLIRSPLRGDWAGQGAPGYRTAAAVLGDRGAVLADADAAVDALLRHHLAAHGPSSRHDLAWWSGLGLTQVDAAIVRLGLTAEEGPDGRSYLELPGAPSATELTGVRLLPEYDALLCGYHPASRMRFVSAADYQVIWQQANGALRPPLLIGNRIGGYWQLRGSGARRQLEITRFAHAARVRRSALDEPVAALAAALGLRVTAVELT